MKNEEYQEKMTEMLFENAYDKEYISKLKKEVEDLTGYKYDTNDYIGMVEDLISVVYKYEERLAEEIQYREDNFRQLTPAEMGWENETC